MIKTETLKELEQASPQEILSWAWETFGEKVALSSSFSVEDMVLLDMMMKVNKRMRVFTLDTGRLPEETYQLIEKVRERYGIKIEVYYPNTKAIEEFVREYGINAFYLSRQLRHKCCQLRKVEPLERALGGLEAWICGLRREQAVTRQSIKKIEIDEAHNGILKINPLADWTEAEVWQYIRQKDVPYNELYKRGYRSIGCEPCTRAIEPDEDIRCGRWWWEPPESKECGLHLPKK